METKEILGEVTAWLHSSGLRALFLVVTPLYPRGHHGNDDGVVGQTWDIVE